MTLQTALRAARRRRLRPEGYERVAGAFVAFLLLVVALRLGANLYLAQSYRLPGPTHSESPAGRLFLMANAAWCSLFVAAVAPVIAFRGVAGTIGSRRLALMPLRTPQRFAALVSASFRSAPVYVPFAVAVVAWLISSFGAPGGAASGFGLVVAVLAIGAVGFTGVIAAAWALHAAEERLELIEVTLLFVMFLANPDPSTSSGRAQLMLFMYFRFDASGGPVVWLLPLAGSAFAALAVAASEALSRARAWRVRGPTGLILYARRIPAALFAASYAAEIPIILLNPSLRSVVRHVVVTLAVLRVVWFVAFLFRTEQQIAEVIRAPNRPSDRFALYWPPAALHAALCAVPVLLYLSRFLV